ncbi:iron complex outermembrane recepter protein [Roseateles sp. YR242]|uniref:TonB-dependent siderophore receptor n=1 Tax=Roseateles sp. YR242 TaxID=1855305 RepID=UPI0008C67799|nr:TonB-dependent siderophore receptor [Roseateles sp. YR242]SEL61751.1 iron complex outermembrane recepter protein [Roseateles sp. YR242]
MTASHRDTDFRLTPLNLALRAALAGAAGLLLAQGAWAQTQPAEAAVPADEAKPTLPTVRVQGNRDKSIVVKRSSAGTKTDTALIEVPQSLHVITAKEIEDMGITTLTEAVRQTPGVTVNPYGSDSRAPDWVILRGFDGWYTSSYRDGLIQTVGLTFLGVQTELYGLERLEILLGPSSVLFGKGDVGGVVNRVSKVPDAGMVSEVEVQVGSYDRKQVAADVGGALTEDGRLRWRLVGLKLDTGTQEKYPDGERMKRERDYLAPSLRWDLTPQSSLILQYEHLQDDASDDVQYVTGADGNPTSVKEGDPSYSRIKTGSDAGGYQFEHHFDGDWRLSHKLRYARRTMDKHHILSFLDDDGTTLERQARHDVESVKETTVDTSVQGSATTGPLTHGLLFGVDWDRSRAKWQRWADMTTPLDMNDPVYGVTIANPTTPAADTLVTTTQLGFYAQDQLKWDDHWRVTVGLRHDRVKTDSDDRLYEAQASQKDSATTGRVGLNYLVGNGWSPYVSYAESFVPNIGVDFTGATFVPSDGRQVEVGVKYIPQDKPFSFTAAFFNLKKTNVVSYDPVSFDAHQIGNVRSRGLELSAKAELTRQWRLTAAYTSFDLKVLSSANPDEVGHTPILVPEQTGNLWLDYSFDGAATGLGVSGGVRYVGKRWNNETNTSSQPAYTLADASVRYTTGPWRFSLSVSNLFNKHYYSAVAYGSYFRGEDRAVLLSAKYHF